MTPTLHKMPAGNYTCTNSAGQEYRLKGTKNVWGKYAIHCYINGVAQVAYDRYFDDWGEACDVFHFLKRQ